MMQVRNRASFLGNGLDKPWDYCTLSLSENSEFMALTRLVSTLEHTSDRIEKKVQHIQWDISCMSLLFNMMAMDSFNLSADQVQEHQQNFSKRAVQETKSEDSGESGDKQQS